VGAGVKARSGATLDAFPSRCGGSDRAVSHHPRPPVRRGHAASRARGLGESTQAGAVRGVSSVQWTAARARAHGRTSARLAGPACDCGLKARRRPTKTETRFLILFFKEFSNNFNS
jgi:hypothetical protein